MPRRPLIAARCGLCSSSAEHAGAAAGATDIFDSNVGRRGGNIAITCVYNLFRQRGISVGRHTASGSVDFVQATEDQCQRSTAAAPTQLDTGVEIDEAMLIRLTRYGG